MEAVKNHVGALEFASEELRNNAEIVMEAVKRDGYSL
jgi:ribosomal protein L1